MNADFLVLTQFAGDVIIAAIRDEIRVIRAEVRPGWGSCFLEMEFASVPTGNWRTRLQIPASDLAMNRPALHADLAASYVAEAKRTLLECMKDGQVQGSQTGVQTQSAGRESASGGGAGTADAQLPVNADSHLSRTRTKAKAAARTR